jgi:hypothetical protein
MLSARLNTNRKATMSTEWFEASQEPHGLKVGDRVQLMTYNNHKHYVGEALVTEVDEDIIYLAFNAKRVGGTRKFHRVSERCRRPGIWWRAQASKQFGYAYYGIEKVRDETRKK